MYCRTAENRAISHPCIKVNNKILVSKEVCTMQRSYQTGLFISCNIKKKRKKTFHLPAAKDDAYKNGA